MNQMTSAKPDSSTPPLSSSRIDPWELLLDSAFVLLTNWKLLIIGPLIAGAIAYAGSFLLQKSYRSYAYVGPLDQATATRSAALIFSPAVLDAALRALPNILSTVAVSERSTYLKERVRFSPVNLGDPKSQLYAFGATDSDPARARAILTAVIEAWLIAMKPPPEKLASLNRMKDAWDLQAADLSTAITTLMQHPELLRADVKTGYAPVNVGDLVRLRTEGVAKGEELKSAMVGLGSDTVVLPPTTPGDPVGPMRRSISMFAAGIAFVVLCALLLARGVFVPALSVSAYGSKVGQLRDAIWKRRSPLTDGAGLPRSADD
jgi:hypothetical protein